MARPGARGAAKVRTRLTRRSHHPETSLSGLPHRGRPPSIVDRDRVHPAEPPTDAISSFATSEMSISGLALTRSAISPPLHCWNRLGGSLVCSAAVKRVRRSSFWSAVISIFTFGCAVWYSVATVCQKLFNGSLLPLCHQVMVTGLLELALLVRLLPEPPPLPAASSI